MKHLFFVLVFICSSTVATAQSTFLDMYEWGIGPFYTARYSLNTSNDLPSESSKGGLSVLGDIGVQAYIPLSKKNNIGFVLQAALSQYSFGIDSAIVRVDNQPFVPSVRDNVTTTTNYLSITPGISASFMHFGLNVGIPMSTKRVTSAGADLGSIQQFKDIDASGQSIPSQVDAKDFLTPMLELRAGVIYPVINNDFGRFNVLANIGYSFTRMYDNDIRRDYRQEDASPRLFSLTVGLSYLFNVTSSPVY